MSHELRHHAESRGGPSSDRARPFILQVADSLAVHLLQIDRADRILFANAAAANHWGLRVEEMIGKTVAEVIGTEASQALARHAARALAGETVSYESPFRAADG